MTREHGQAQAVNGGLQMSEIKQRPKNGEIVNTEWIDMENQLVDVEVDGETFREIYTFSSVEKLDEEDN